MLLRVATTEFFRAHVEAGARHLEESERLANELGLRDIAFRAAGMAGHFKVLAGDLQEAEAIYRKFASAAAEAGAGQFEVVAYRFVAYALSYQGRPREAAEALDHALELSEAAGERWNRSELLSNRAQAALDLGDLDAADELIARSLELVRSDDVTGVSEAYHHLGMIRAAQGREEEAEAALRRAHEVVRTTDYEPGWSCVNAELALAEYLAERGRVAQARDLVDKREPRLHAVGWHRFDAQIARIRQLIASAGARA
jgi:tetratricopeptide (TPR) repeat protein